MSKSIKNNYLYNVVYEILIILLPLITSPYLTRTLGAENLGIYTYTYTIVSYFVLFAKLGIVNHGSRELANQTSQEGRSRVFVNLFSVQFLVSIFVIVVYLIYVLFISVEFRTIALIQLLFLLATAIDINWAFFGLEEFKVTVTRNIAIKILNTVLIFALVNNPGDLNTYVIISSVCNFIGQAVMWTQVKKHFVFIKPDISQMISNLKPLLLLFIPTIAVSVYKMMDKIMLGEMCSKAEVAYYEYASMFVNIPLGFITSLGTVMMPRISKLAGEGEKKKSLEYTSLSMIFVMALSVAMAFGLSAIAPDFIPWYLGKDFDASVDLLIGLSVTLVFLAWANVIRTQFLIPYKKDKPYIISLLAGAFVNLGFNVCLIGRIGAMGAVIGTIAAEFVVCLLQTIFASKELEFIRYLRESAGFFVIGLVMYLCVRSLRFTSLSGLALVICEVLSGVLVYSVCSFVYLYYVLKLPVVHNIVHRILRKGRR